MIRISLILSLILAYVFGCSEGGESERRGGQGSRGAWGGRATAAIPVKGEKVTRADMNSYVETYARLKAEREVSVLARTTGLVEVLTVEEGDRVRQGRVLVQLDKEKLGLNLRQAQAAFEEASSNYERIKVLHNQRMVSQSEYEITRLRFANAKLSLEESELNLTYADLTAPITGVITQRLVELGDLVRGDQEVFIIADLDPLLVRIFVPERRMYQLHPGQEANIAVEALPDREFSGKIRMISPEVDPESGTVKVTLEVTADGLLKPGMFATVRIITARRPQTLIVPKKALVLETDEDDVFLIEEGKVKRIAIELGFVEGDKVEVVSGLKEGDQVVTVGHEGLKDGAAVRLAGTSSAQAASDPPDEDDSQWRGHKRSDKGEGQHGKDSGQSRGKGHINEVMSPGGQGKTPTGDGAEGKKSGGSDAERAAQSARSNSAQTAQVPR